MESDTLPIVSLEVTVPRIVFATGTSSTGQGETLPIQHQYTDEDEEQVRLVPIGGQRQDIAGETSAHMIHAIRFRLFRMQVLAQGQRLLLQILRPWRKPIAESQGKENAPTAEHGQAYISAVSALSVEFRRRNNAAEKTLPEMAGQGIRAGLNHVIIYLDSEGTPSSYNIDGAQG